MVTTGQQAGLFTGPLYTIHKALTTVRLARALETELDVLVLPVFWVASDDHDWLEANHAYLQDQRGLHRLELRSTDRRPLPMSERRLESDVERILDKAAETIDGTEYGEHYLRLLREAYVPGRTVAEAFAELVAELLAPYDVLIADAANPALKRASRGVLRDAVSEWSEQESALRSRTAEVVEAGYHAQVPVLEGATNVFHHGGGGRERLYVRDGRVVGSETGRRTEVDEVLEQIETDPDLFSPNVFLRPVVESAVFPTLAYVGGPGELSYFAQLAPLFGLNGIEPPVVYPRASFTLVEGWAAEGLERLGLEMGGLERPRHELVEDLARRAVPLELRRALDALAGAVSEGYREAIDAAMRLDPTLAGALGAQRNESLGLVGRAERKVLRRIKDLQGERTVQLDRVRAQLAPAGQPQERVLNVIPFLARHGPELVEALLARVEVPWRSRVAGGTA